MACIYKITNTADNNKVYIGYTTRTAERRLFEHWVARTNSNFNLKITQAFRSFPRSAFKVETIVEGDFNKELLRELEKHYIRLYASTFPDRGYNTSIGGYGGIIDTIKTPEGRAAAAERARNQPISPKAIEAARRRFIGNRYAKVAVLQYDLEGNFIKEWDCYADAAKHIGASHAHLYQVLCGNRKRVKGFFFKYRDK